MILWMVFGWGKKKQARPVEETVRIPLAEAAELARSAMERRTEQVVSEVVETQERINVLVEEMLQIRGELEGDDLGIEEIDHRLRSQVVRGKRMLLDTIKNNAVRTEKVQNYADMVRLGGALEHRLKRMGNALGKQTRSIHVFAEKYANQLKQILEEMDRGRQSVLTAIQKHQAGTHMEGSVTGGIHSIDALEQSVIQNAANRVDYVDRLERMEYELGRALDAANRFRSSEEYAGWQQVQRNLQNAIDAEAALSSEIAARFTPLSRPLSRYTRVSADKDLSKLLNRTLKDPYKTMKDEGSDGLISLLEKVRQAVMSGSISVKDTSKTEGVITQMQQDIPDMVEKSRRAVQNTHSASEAVRAAGRSPLEEMQDGITKLEEEKGLLEQKRDDAASAAKGAAAAIPNELIRIQDALRQITGTRYVVTYTPP